MEKLGIHNESGASKRPTRLILMWAMVEEARDLLGQHLGLTDYESDFDSLPSPVIFCFLFPPALFFLLFVSLWIFTTILT